MKDKKLSQKNLNEKSISRNEYYVVESNLRDLNKKSKKRNASPKKKDIKKKKAFENIFDLKNDENNCDSNIVQIEKTRSGRRIAKPGQYWIAAIPSSGGLHTKKTSSSDETVTSLAQKKRKWGNSLL